MSWLVRDAFRKGVFVCCVQDGFGGGDDRGWKETRWPSSWCRRRLESLIGKGSYWGEANCVLWPNEIKSWFCLNGMAEMPKLMLWKEQQTNEVHRSRSSQSATIGLITTFLLHIARHFWLFCCSPQSCKLGNGFGAVSMFTWSWKQNDGKGLI